jgi:DNA-binding transcriptional ArsR family regulator
MATESLAVNRLKIGESHGLSLGHGRDARNSTSGCEISDREFVDNDRARALAAAFKAIGHPVRMRILELLTRQEDPVCVCDIETQFALTQPTISHHLRVLRKAGLVDSERKGTWIYYTDRVEGVGPLRAFLDHLFLSSPTTAR